MQILMIALVYLVALVLALMESPLTRAVVMLDLPEKVVKQVNDKIMQTDQTHTSIRSCQTAVSDFAFDCVFCKLLFLLLGYQNHLQTSTLLLQNIVCFCF